jgi:hypothetical protein
MRILDVVNEMLGTMGETPLNSLLQPHPFLAAAKKALEDKNREIQARGWWYNTEAMVGRPSPEDSHIYLSSDILEVRAPSRNVVQRGDRLYDLDTADTVFTADIDLSVVRLIPFEQLPELAAQFIAAEAVKAFQKNYDGDRAKTEELRGEAREARAEARAQHIRSVRANFFDSNYTLSRLRRLVYRVR